MEGTAPPLFASEARRLGASRRGPGPSRDEEGCFLWVLFFWVFWVFWGTSMGFMFFFFNGFEGSFFDSIVRMDVLGFASIRFHSLCFYRNVQRFPQCSGFPVFVEFPQHHDA